MATEVETQTPKSKIAFVTLTMPDEKKHDIPLPPKTFSSGRKGYFAQIPSFIFENEL